MPWLPVRSLMRTQFNSLAKIRNYHGPLLQSHGTADRLIPFAMGRQLFEAANEPKQFIAIPGGDHNDPQTERILRGPLCFSGQALINALQQIAASAEGDSPIFAAIVALSKATPFRPRKSGQSPVNGYGGKIPCEPSGSPQVRGFRR